ncbi:MAG: hypothetical protein K1Y36_23220 [Blastocatellia bacterium]|nr:hypothetical protein [Blastocatellia bacterium]
MGLFGESLKSYFGRVGALFRQNSPLPNPFGEQKVDWMYCYDIRHLPGLQPVLFLAAYSTGSGNNRTTTQYIGMYLPAAPGLTEDWLLGWREYLALRSDFWSTQSGLPAFNRSWGLLGPPATLPFQVRRTQDGGVWLAWIDNQSAKNIEARLQAVAESLKLEQSVASPVQAGLPWAPAVSPLPRHLIPCPVCSNLISRFEHPALCSYCHHSFDSFPQDVPQRGPRLTLIRPHPIPIAFGTLVWLGTNLPVLASFLTRNGEVPWAELPGGILAGLGSLAGAFLMKRWGRVPVPAFLVLLLTGLVLLVKPIVAPVYFVYEGTRTVFSYSSETHFYFVIPGIGALIFGGLFFAHWFFSRNR